MGPEPPPAQKRLERISQLVCWSGATIILTRRLQQLRPPRLLEPFFMCEQSRTDPHVTRTYGSALQWILLIFSALQCPRVPKINECSQGVHVNEISPHHAARWARAKWAGYLARLCSTATTVPEIERPGRHRARVQFAQAHQPLAHSPRAQSFRCSFDSTPLDQPTLLE